MMVLDKEDGRWRAGVPTPRAPAPAPRRAGTHTPGHGAHTPGCAGLAGREVPRALGTGVGRQGSSGLRAPGAGPGRTGPREGELRSGSVMLCGAAWRLRLPSDLGAAAVRVERFVFAAAPLTAAITLAPHA